MKQFSLKLLGWTALLDIPLFLGSILLLIAFNFYSRLNPNEAYFDLFVLHLLHQDFEDSVYWIQEPKPGEELDIEWILNEEEIKALKKPKMTIINHGGSFYANSRDVKDNYWIHVHYNIHKGGEVDSTVDGMWCGTGMFYQLIKAGEKIEFTWYNSLFEKVSTPYYEFKSEPTNPDIEIDEIFGDSTEIYWTLLTFSTPWSRYVPQFVKSPSIMVYNENLKETWRKHVGIGSPKIKITSVNHAYHNLSRMINRMSTQLFASKKELKY